MSEQSFAEYTQPQTSTTDELAVEPSFTTNESATEVQVYLAPPYETTLESKTNITTPTITEQNNIDIPTHLRGEKPEPLISRRGFLGILAAGVVVTGVGAGVLGGRKEHKASSSVPTASEPEQTQSPERIYPHHEVTTTIFGIGEGPRTSNGNHRMTQSAWEGGIDPDTGKPIVIALFGGVDDPFNRNRHGLPKGFEPLHNPFYVGIPFDEFDEDGLIPGARDQSFWADEPQPGDELSLFKGRWVMIRQGDKTVYAQWFDTAVIDDGKPVEDNYVFKKSSVEPKDKVKFKMSPATAFALGRDVRDGNFRIRWQFVNEADVPEGPWMQYQAIDNEAYWY